MVADAFGMHFEFEPHESVEQTPNEEAKYFYEQLEAGSRALSEGSMYSQFFVAVRLLNIKTNTNISQAGMDSFIGIMSDLVDPTFNILEDFYKVKRLAYKLGLSSMRIDCCEDSCMLYYKGDADLESYKFCEKPRFKRVSSRKKVVMKSMHYLPLIPRLKRLYASMSSAPHMRWHYENRRSPGVMCHPSDGEAWKRFDRTYSDYASEPRNVRLGLYADGFTPVFVSATPYSCWLVFITPYNLLPEMCMTSSYIFLSCVISGPRNPKSLINVYLQPLIDELKQLWYDGVETYGISTKQNFNLHANLMWTINNFLAYGMLSGRIIAGKLACPYCMKNGKAFTLRHFRKQSWFDCHRQFLSVDHEFRRMMNTFKKNTVEHDLSPPILSGKEIWERIQNFTKVTEALPFRFSGYGVTHNRTKHSIFWEFPYWKDTLLRHNLDVMHIERNYFDNLFNTVMDDKNKTKDNPKARLDLQEYCRRPELYLQSTNNGKVFKPKTSYTFTLEQRRKICEWVTNLKMLEGCSSNLKKCVDMVEGKLTHMKSHDCHIFMKTLIPTAFCDFSENIWKPITEISLFFKDLCSTTLKEENIFQMNRNIHVISNKMERIFPCGFFHVIEHLPIHLVHEA
ncbi:uncharacterized protein [Nicotiana tomentosiformis]|uniref:uncharacterized protein n=1 Tax=Nicotiana tomentosiformis TaxID=4098 RepID=UPI00388C8048